jgi:hypothetical protein
MKRYKNAPISFAMLLRQFIRVQFNNTKQILMKLLESFSKKCRHIPVLIKI